MDKMAYINNNIKHKNGFALMITLSVLSVIIALSMVLMSYFEKVQEDASDTKALIQADVYYADIVAIFRKFKDKKQLFSTLYKSPLPLYAPKGNFSLVLRCTAMDNGVNINWLGLENDKKKMTLHATALDLFENLTQRYILKDPDRLLEMIVEEIGGKNKYVEKEQSRLHQKNGIITYLQFSDIVKRYQFEVDDDKVSSISWKKYFTFSIKAEKIDEEYISAELVAYLFDIDLITVREWMNLEEKSSLKVFVEDNGGGYDQRKEILAGDTFMGSSACSVGYAFLGSQYRFRFKYIKGDAKYFEFFGKR